MTTAPALEMSLPQAQRLPDMAHNQPAYEVLKALEVHGRLRHEPDTAERLPGTVHNAGAHQNMIETCFLIEVLQTTANLCTANMQRFFEPHVSCFLHAPGEYTKKFKRC